MWEVVLVVSCWDREHIRDKDDDDGPELEERFQVKLDGMLPTPRHVQAAMRCIGEQAERWLMEREVNLWNWVVVTVYSIERRD